MRLIALRERPFLSPYDGMKRTATMQTDAPDMHRVQSLARMHLLHRVADRIPAASGDDCVRVGIDGVDGSGKSIFADELAAVVRGCGRAVVRISLDDFHHVRAVRYRRGRSSPEGFWLDSYNYERLRTDVLDPFSPRGSAMLPPCGP